MDTRSGLRAVRDPGRIRRMDDQGLVKRRGFWLLAFLWLPGRGSRDRRSPLRAGGGARMWLSMMLMSARSLVPVALGRRRLWRLGYRRASWTAGIGLGAFTGGGGSSNGVEAGGRRAGCAARRAAQCAVSLSGAPFSAHMDRAARAVGTVPVIPWMTIPICCSSSPRSQAGQKASSELSGRVWVVSWSMAPVEWGGARHRRYGLRR